ncbi:hypothetical protein [Acinetobacter lanii]|nr:hypothetical protein [Acinetobacter lanii]
MVNAYSSYLDISSQGCKDTAQVHHAVEHQRIISNIACIYTDTP